MLAMFAGLVTEAAACGSEPVSDVIAEASYHTGQGEDVPSDEDHETHKACSHGHCHHANNALSRASELPLAAFGEEILFPGSDAINPGSRSSNLKRPPRA